MAYNTYSHAILSASLVSYPELALGSGYHATCTTASIVSLTAGSEVITTNPLLSGGIGVLGDGRAIANGKNALSGTIGIKKLGAIGTHPVSMLLYNPPPTIDGMAEKQTSSPSPAGAAGVAPMHTGTCAACGYGNLNNVCNQKVFTYELISPEDTETVSKHRPHLCHIGSTFITSSVSGITVALRTAPAAATFSRHQIKGHEDSGIEVQYYLGDPLSLVWGGGVGSTFVSAGLSSSHSAFVGPEHARKRLLGF